MPFEPCVNIQEMIYQTDFMADDDVVGYDKAYEAAEYQQYETEKGEQQQTDVMDFDQEMQDFSQ